MADNLTLNINHVSKSFARIEKDDITNALADVDLHFHSKEFVSLVGTSGCGKSTILRLIAGLITPTSGSLDISGTPITKPGPDRGMVFQKPTLFPWLTVKKNVEFSLKMQNRLNGNEELVDRMLRLIHLEAFKDDYPGQLSGGMAQRVALVRSLISNPEILLMDEPLGALDAYQKLNFTETALPVFFGIDGTGVGLEAVLDGRLAGTVYNDKEGQAAAMAKLAAAIATGEGKDDISFKNKRYIYLPYTKVTSDNAGSFLGETPSALQ